MKLINVDSFMKTCRFYDNFACVRKDIWKLGREPVKADVVFQTLICCLK